MFDTRFPPGIQPRYVISSAGRDNGQVAERGDPRSTRAWQKQRAYWAGVIGASEVSCWRCGEHIYGTDEWDLGHKNPVRAGGANGDARPEHRACNRAGAPVPRELRGNGGRPARPAQERQGAGPGVTVAGKIVRDYPGGVRPATGSRYPGPSRDW